MLLENLNDSVCKLNKIWVNKSSEFCNRSMKSFLQNNDINKVFYTYILKETLLWLKYL